MNKVKNGRCITQISTGSLKANRTRNIIFVIAIALTTLLITSVFTIGGSMIKSIERSTMHQVGTSAHGGFKYLDRQQYDRLCEDSEIKDISYNIIVGFAENEELKDEYTEIRYTEEKSAEWSFSMPQTGRLPQDKNEIAVPTSVLDALDVPHELGAEVPLEFTIGDKQYSENFVLCGYWEKPAETLANEAFVSRAYQQSVAPEWENPADGEKMLAMNSYAGSINPSLWFSSASDIEGQMQDLKDRCGFGADVNEGVNWAYTTSDIGFTQVMLASLILLLVIASGYLIIYNIFYISVSTDIRFYGLLKTIGTTGRQLRKIVYRQALMLSGIGIPMGLLTGYIVTLVIFPKITEALTSIPCEVYAKPQFFIISAAFALVTVLISCIKPCRLLKKISPVEAVKYQQEQSHSGRRRKTVFVVLSLALSIIMLNSTVTIVRGFDMDKYLENYVVTDFIVTDSSIASATSLEVNTKGVSKKDAAALEETTGIEGFGKVYMDESQQKLEGKTLTNAKSIFKERSEDFYSEEEKTWIKSEIFEENVLSSHVYGVSEFIYDYLDIVKGDFDAAKFASGEYVIVTGYDDRGKLLYYDIGDTISVDFADGSSKNYEVMAIGEVPYSLSVQHGHGMDIYIVLPESEYLSHCKGADAAMLAAFNVKDESFDDAEEYVSGYCENADSSLSMTSKQDYVDSFHETELMYLMVGGVLSFILGLIGVLNFINVTITSINARRNVLAVMQAVGMTDKQLKHMLIKESMQKILLTFAFAITIGSLLTFAIVKLITVEMWMFTYHFTIWPVFASVPVFLLIAVIVPAVLHNIMRKESLVERLREE